MPERIDKTRVLTIAADIVCQRSDGVAQCVRGLVPALREADCSNQVISLHRGSAAAEHSGAMGLPISCLRAYSPWHYSATLWPTIQGLAKSGTVIHQHGLWHYSAHVCGQARKRLDVPLLISPHGMLDSYAMQRSRWKKALAWRLYQRRELQDADCLHALNPGELAAIRELGITTPVAIIRNGTQLPELDAMQTLPDPAPRSWQQAQIALFLGRIDPKKGVEPMIHAWARVASCFPDWRLAIVGPVAAGYRRTVRTAIETAGLTNSVGLFEPAYNDRKAAWFARSALFVLPSRSEGLPVAALEAFAHARPALLSTACNLPEAADRKAALTCTAEVASIAEGLVQFLAMHQEDRQQMGRAARQLVNDRFTWNQVAAEFRQVYQWLLQQDALPQCVDKTTES